VEKRHSEPRNPIQKTGYLNSHPGSLAAFCALKIVADNNLKKTEPEVKRKQKVL
jgi:hypothetical protein